MPSYEDEIAQQIQRAEVVTTKRIKEHGLMTMVSRRDLAMVDERWLCGTGRHRYCDVVSQADRTEIAHKFCKIKVTKYICVHICRVDLELIILVTV